MSLHPQSLTPIPEQTAAVAQAAFPKGNRYLSLRDELGVFYQDLDFAPLFAVRGRPAQPPWRLALVSVFQFMEGYSDAQAAEAVRSRIDWKYALSLELTDAGFDASVLSEFRSRLVAGQAEMQLLDTLLERFQAAGYLRARGRQRTDSTHVLAAVRTVNRLVLVGETLRHALNTLADSAAEWLQPRIQPEWVECYGRRFDDYRLPKGEAERQALAAQIGADGRTLLTQVCDPQSPAWLRQIDSVRILQRVWLEQYVAVAPDQSMRWREASDQPASAQRIHSPYDPEARYSTKRTTSWLGYKVHLTETCDADTPHLITRVLTTPATTPDFEAPAAVLADLAAKGLLPSEHLLDAGYVDGELLVTSQADHQVDLVAPVLPDHSWQALSPDGLDVSHFLIDWEKQQVTCPQGHISRKWSHTHNQGGHAIINVRFAPAACAVCPVREHCTRSPTGPRHMTFHPRAEHEALQARRQWQQTPEFKAAYDPRAGIEGTLSCALRTTGMRHSRYLGLAKTHLQNVLCAAAINLCRIADWLSDRPRAQTRTAAFLRLALT